MQKRGSQPLCCVSASLISRFSVRVRGDSPPISQARRRQCCRGAGDARPAKPAGGVRADGRARTNRSGFCTRCRRRACDPPVAAHGSYRRRTPMQMSTRPSAPPSGLYVRWCDEGGTIGSTMCDECVRSTQTQLWATTEWVWRPIGSPVLGLTSKRGKLLLEMSSRRR
jgi:hypothetical protein